MRDIDRLFQEFPFQPVNNLILMTQDGWRTVYFGKPCVYSLFAAPFAGLFGVNGLLFFNMLLTVAMIWMGYALSRPLQPGGDAPPSTPPGFFLLSAGFSYVFWLQPEVFNMAAVAACLYFGLPRDEPGGTGMDRRSLALAALSGAVLVFAVYNKPMLAAVGLAPLWGYVRRRTLEDGGVLAGRGRALHGPGRRPVRPDDRHADLLPRRAARRIHGLRAGQDAGRADAARRGSRPRR